MSKKVKWNQHGSWIFCFINLTQELAIEVNPTQELEAKTNYAQKPTTKTVEV
jgi:hypothetical protein